MIDPQALDRRAREDQLAHAYAAEHGMCGAEALAVLGFWPASTSLDPKAAAWLATNAERVPEQARFATRSIARLKPVSDSPSTSISASQGWGPTAGSTPAPLAARRSVDAAASMVALFNNANGVKPDPSATATLDHAPQPSKSRATPAQQAAATRAVALFNQAEKGKHHG